MIPILPANVVRFITEAYFWAQTSLMYRAICYIAGWVAWGNEPFYFQDLKYCVKKLDK